MGKLSNTHKKDHVCICWFRRDLRLFDNAAFYHALNSGTPVLPVFIFDKDILKTLHEVKDKRVSFIYQALKRMEKELHENGSSILIVHDTPKKAFEDLIEKYDISAVYTNHDYEPYAIDRDNKIADLLLAHEIPLHTFKDQVVYEKGEILKPDGDPYTVFTPYSKTWKQAYGESKQVAWPAEKELKNLFRTKPFSFPQLTDIGFEDAGISYPEWTLNEKQIRNYHKTRNLPAVDGTSQVSVHLRFGTVSARQLVAAAQRLNQQWLNELIWREFFMMLLYHFPHVVNQSFKKKYDHIRWRNDEKEFEKWCKGETGFPIVDAGMRQLNETGWMHNRVRMITASFLTKHLLIDWRWGEAYFAEKLLDYELSSNNGNWQWAAGSGADSAPYFRIFNPHTQIQKFDPELVYIKKWINDFRPGYLPEIVKHELGRKRALEVYKTSLEEA